MLVKIIEKGCPICSGDVKGNVRMRFYCSECNILFRSFQLVKNAKIKEVITDNKEVLKRVHK